MYKGFKIFNINNQGYYMIARGYEVFLRVLKNTFQHEKRNIVSPSGHV